MPVRSRNAEKRSRRSRADWGVLVLVLALAFALAIGGSLGTASRRSASVELWYLDKSTGEPVVVAHSVALPAAGTERIGAVLELLRVPPEGKGLATAVPKGFALRRATWIQEGVLRVVTSTPEEQRPMGFVEELALYRQLVNTLLSLPEVQALEVSVEGHPPGTFLSYVKTQRELAPFREIPDRGQPADLYFLGVDGTYVVESRTIPSGLSRSQTAYQLTRSLMDGPMRRELRSALPPSQYLRGVTVTGQMATVDLVQDVLKLGVDANREQQAVDCLVLTLTRMPGVSGVRVCVEGNPVSSLFGHIPMELPLYRFGGRVEEGTAIIAYHLVTVDGDLLPAVSVTLQANASTSRNEMIARAFAQLTLPPQGSSSLITAGSRVTAMQLDAGTGTLSMSISIPSMPTDSAGEELLVEQLRLTLTELPSVAAVRMIINGAVAFLPHGYYVGRTFQRQEGSDVDNR